MKALTIAYGVVCYLVFLVAFLYAIGFVADVVAPQTIDSGAAGALVPSLIIDTGLLSVFAVQHSLMARPFYKKATARFVPPAIERSTYVVSASLALLLIYWQWRPQTGVVWNVASEPLRALVWAICASGWLLVLASTFLINHFDLFGLRQVWMYRRAGETPPPEFVTPMFYKVVRHPIYLGFIIAFWVAPTMTVGHLFFAVVTTAYILVAIQFEEHDLIDLFGDRYADYRRRVSMLLPLKWGG